MKLTIPTRTIELGLKFIVGAAAFAAVTGIQGVHWHPGTFTITQHSVGGRLLAGALGVACGFAAYGCQRRKLYGWWIVTTMLGILGIYSIIYSVRTLTTTNLGPFANILGAIAFTTKTGFVGWLLCVQWLPRKKEFS